MRLGHSGGLRNNLIARIWMKRSRRCWTMRPVVLLMRIVTIALIARQVMDLLHQEVTKLNTITRPQTILSCLSIGRKSSNQLLL